MKILNGKLRKKIKKWGKKRAKSLQGDNEDSIINSEEYTKTKHDFDWREVIRDEVIKKRKQSIKS